MIQPYLSKKEVCYVGDVLTLSEGANNKGNRKEAVDLMKFSSISWKKVTLVKVQTATTKQYGNIFGSNILIFILNWCKKGMNDIARWVVNTIVAIMHHFIIGGEKSCFMALSNGNCKVIGYLWKTKHEKYIVDNVTTYRSETVGCSTGPAMIF